MDRVPFETPIKISEPLARLLGHNMDLKITRLKATMGVVQYCREHDLFRGSLIIVDDALFEVLQSRTITMVNLQALLRPHYILPNA